MDTRYYMLLKRDIEHDMKHEDITPPPEQRAIQSNLKATDRLDQGNAAKGQASATAPINTHNQHRASFSKRPQEIEGEEGFASSGSVMMSGAISNASLSQPPRDDGDHCGRSTSVKGSNHVQPNPPSLMEQGAKAWDGPSTESEEESEEVPYQSRISGRWACTLPGCSSSFTRGQDLQRHIRTVHNKSESRMCCGRNYSRKDALDRHIRHSHRKRSIRGDPLAAQQSRQPSLTPEPGQETSL